MNAYIDSALFVKAFVLEANSEETIRLLEETGCKTFVSYDTRQRKAAELSGLRVLPVCGI